MSRQSRHNWFAAQAQRAPRQRSSRSSGLGPHTRFHRPLRLEPLEARRLLATFTVTNLADTGVGSLPERIDKANQTAGADIINFASNLSGGTIVLTGNDLEITDNLTIQGLGSGQLTVQMNNGRRIFTIDNGAFFNDLDIEISGLTLTGGDVADPGGAIFSREDLTLEDTVITGNTAIGLGGAIYSDFANLTINRSTISGNTTTLDPSNFSSGGGVYAKAGLLTVNESTFEDNIAFEGGAIAVVNSDLELTRSTIHDNNASHGGGIHFSYSAGEILSSTISGNDASFNGGAIRVDSPAAGGVNIRHSTIVDNEAGNFGGGVFGTVAFDHALVAQNTVGFMIGNDHNGIATAYYSLIQNPAGQVTNIDNTSILGGSGLPVVGPLADNGGPTRTHLLLSGSPAIDAGDPSFSPPPSTDQRGGGSGRTFDGDFNGSVVIDIGAIEMQALPGGGVPLIVDSALDEIDGVTTPGNFSLREAIALANGSFGADTISFDPTLNGQTILLTLGELPIGEELTITGPGTTAAGRLTIDAGGNSRIFRVDDGAAYFDQTIEISGLTLTGGHATIGMAGDSSGGAISNDEILTLQDMVIEGNVAEGAGGGVRSEGQLHLIDSIVSGNQAMFGGGGISGVDYILRSVISDNTAVFEGGGISNARNLHINESTISGNMAGDGGGLSLSEAFLPVEVLLEQSTVSGNSASLRGPGISLNEAFLQLNHSTVAFNTGMGTAIQFAAESDSAFVRLNHSIVAANSGADFFNPGVSNNEVEAFHSLVGNRGNVFITSLFGLSTNIIGSSTNVIDPLLAPLDDYGGATQTHALLAGSPALDAGDPDFPQFDDILLLNFPNYDFDQRDAPFGRVYDGDFDGETVIDIGAHERPPELIVDTTNDNLDGDVSPGNFSLREAVTFANGMADPGPITFAGSLAGETLVLSLGELPIKQDIIVQGLGADQLTINAGGNSRIFNVDNGIDGDFLNVMINDLTLSGGGNVAEGGAIASRELLTVRRSVISDSQADFGGGIHQFLGALTVDSSTIVGNSASQSGGGLFAEDGTVSTTNSTLSGNDAGDDGGGLFLSGSTANLDHTTITNNATGGGSGQFGGGVASNSSVVTLDHTIVAGNTGFVTAPEISGSVTAQFSIIGNNAGTTINDLGGNFVGTPVTPIDPLLSVLEDFGGPTPTHAPLAFSLAIDGGDAGFAPPPADDQRGAGFARVLDGDGNASTVIDIGAFERTTVAPLDLVVDLLTDELDADRGPGDLSLREAIEEANLNFGADEIRFLPSLAGQTITLTLGEILITDAVDIDAIDAPSLTIDGGGSSRIFRIDDSNASNDAEVEIKRLRLTGGSAIGDGGAIFSREDLSIFNTDIFGNTATDDGGGIYADDGALTIFMTTIDNNSATGALGDGGGVIARNLNDTSISHSTVSGNTSGGVGGGVFIYRGTAQIINSTISGNDADSAGGGVNSYNATTDIFHSTITDNTSDDNNSGGAGEIGGGVRVHRGTVNLENSIVADNNDRTNTAEDVVNILGGVLNVRHSIVGDGDGSTLNDITGNQIGTGAAPIDPLLGPLLNNGGRTRTHALLAGSPAINTGDNNFTSPPFFDQREKPFIRAADGNPPFNSGLDIGAYERQAIAPSFFVVDHLIDENDGNTDFGETSLREAIALANGSVGADVITFNSDLSGVIDLTLGELVVSDSVTIQGLGSDVITIDGGGASRIFFISDDNPSQVADVVIDGFTLTGGNVNGGSGAAIASLEQLTLRESVITGNTATGPGGAVLVANYGSPGLIENTVFTDNTGSSGGAIRSILGGITINNSTFDDNNGTSGGAISAFNSTVVISDSSFNGNQATVEGGAIGLDNGSLTLTDSTFDDNMATGPTSDGGAIYTDGASSLAITGGSFIDNTTGDDGGAIYSDAATFTVSGVLFDGNSAAEGGALFIVDGDVDVRDSTLSGNTASLGGGVSNFGDELNFLQSTISGNNANSSGGGIYHNSGLLNVRHSTITNNTADADSNGSGRGGGIHVVFGTPQLVHTIVAGNIDNSGTAPDLDDGFVSGSFTARFSLIGDNTGATISNLVGSLIGTGAAPIDPRLAPLAQNSGATPTHALGSDSPAIDAGDIGFNPGAFNPPLTEDQRGASFARIVDGDNNFQNVIDIGAYERQVGNLIVDIIDDENDGNTSPGDLSLREAIQIANELPGLDSIQFDSALAGQTIALGMGQFDIVDSLVIQGLGADQLTIDAAGTSRIFNINDGASANLIDVEIADLTLTGGVTTGDGGAIFVERENVVLDRVVLSGNQASSGGGIWATVFNGSDVIIRDSSIVHNHATSQGGGIRAAGGSNESLQITGTTISGNTANHDGGGLFVFSSSSFPTTVSHSTITNNTTDADDNGSGIGGGVRASLFPTITLDHTIVAGNFNSVTSVRSDVAGTMTAMQSLIGDDSGATITDNGDNQIGTPGAPIDALLGPLVDNGGSTPTHAPSADSPAIDAGLLGIVSPPTNDQRGAPFARIVDGLRDGETAIDIGAVELHNLIVDTTVDENDGDYNFGDLSLREAIVLANALPGMDTITFDASLSGDTITLSLGELDITDDTTIQGLGSGLLTIDANLTSRIFDLDDGDSSHHLDVQLTGLTLTRGNSSSPGGAIHSRESLTLSHSVVSGSQSTNQGGGIYARVADGATTEITDSIITGNSIVTTFRGGGGLSLRADAGGSITIARSTIATNTSDGNFPIGGGARVIAEAGATATISDSTFSGNQAISTFGSGSYGGGLHLLSRGATTVSGVTISGNSSEDGVGGLAVVTSVGGSAQILSSTITANTGATSGGVHSFLFGGSVSLENTIVAGNTGVTAADIAGSLGARFSLVGDNTGATITDVQGNQIGTGGAPIDAMLDPTLADNGGPTLTHTLLAGSPALDAGDPDAVAGVGLIAEFDQRGDPFGRVEDGDNNGVGVIDIGAIEIPTQAPALPGDYNLDGVVSSVDYAIWRESLGQFVPSFTGADGDGDGLVNSGDYQVWKTNFGATAPPATVSTIVQRSDAPEPTSPQTASRPFALDESFAQWSTFGATPGGSPHSSPAVTPVARSAPPFDDHLLLLAALDQQTDRVRSELHDEVFRIAHESSATGSEDGIESIDPYLNPQAEIDRAIAGFRNRL